MIHSTTQPDSEAQRPARATHHAPSRRGLAMLLVIVAVGVGVILSSAALTSNTAATSIGQNAVAAVESYWAAQGAAEYTVGLVQNVENIAALASPDMPNAIEETEGNVVVTVTDLEGNPPDADHRDIIVTAIAKIHGMEHKIVRRISITAPGDLNKAIDPMLDEFAVFCRDRITLADGAIISSWPKSPEADSGRLSKIGLGFANLSDAAISSNARIKGGELYVDESATAALEDLALDQTHASKGESLPFDIPASSADLPTALATLRGSNSPNADYTAVTVPFFSSAAYNRLRLLNGARATLNETSGKLFKFQELRVQTNSVLTISGNIQIAVTASMVVEDGAAIVLTPGSTATIYLGGSLSVSDSVIGIDAAIAQDRARAWADVPYSHPARFRILSLTTASGGATSPSYTIQNNALVLAAIHAPSASIRLTNGAAIFGRATASHLQLDANCALFYDPRLDRRIGFTSTDGPLFDDDGEPIDGLADALADFDANLGCQRLTLHCIDAISDLLEDLLGALSGAFGGSPRTTADITSNRRISEYTVANDAEAIEEDDEEKEAAKAEKEAAKAEKEAAAVAGEGAISATHGNAKPKP